MAAAGAAVLLLAPLPAAAGCWQEREAAAAGLREMQTMLMVATLRCRSAGMDISDEYNAFVVAHRRTLDSANIVIRRHFIVTGAAPGAYDRFATTIANAYGHASTTIGDCAEAGMLARKSAGAAPATLVGIAAARLHSSPLPEGRCPTTLPRTQLTFAR
ncbi:hypothetical protein [Flavisphingomonas formosensis]|uniref:hypothetical protein n=1 Tax=Flavisphingomonas formosensis TaxID=861534 RepID=UPI0012F9481A|nr:hypothetical protein [Sphingomonas formosensis]